MALFFADLVREYSSSTGVGDFVLAGAVRGHRAFAEAVPAGARFHYAIAGVTQPAEWETGEGEIGSGGTLVRSPLASSAGGALVAFSDGLKTVTLTVAADWFAGQEQGVAIGDVAGVSAFGRSLVGGADAAAARTALGLGAAALKATGTSGDAVPVLNGGAAAWASGASFGSSSFADPISGTARFRVADGSMTLSFLNSSGGQGWVAVSNGNITGFIGHTNHAQGFTLGSFSNHPVSIRTGNVARVHIDAAGRVGIGNYGNASAPALTSRLTVEGEMRAQSLRIDAAPEAAAAAATHKLPVSLNGTTYFLLLSSS